MKKIKLLTVLSSLPLLGMVTIPLTSCGNKGDTPTETKCKISFTSSEGVTLSSTEPVEVKEKTKWKDVTKPTVTLAEEYTEIGWYNVSDMVYLEDETEITKDITARFIALKSTDYKVDVTVKVDDKTYGPVPFIQGATFGEFKEQYPDMKTKPTKEHYRFEGWYIGTEKFEDTSVFPLGLATVTIEAKFIPITYTISTAGTSEGITFNNLPSNVNEGEKISATYNIDEIELDETNSDILVGNTSIKSEPDVIYKNGTIFIPAWLTNNNVTIKLIGTVKEGVITTSWSTIISACDTFEQSDRGSAAVTTFLSKFNVGGKTLSTLEDLVGSWKTLLINNQAHIVRIIDTQHDSIVTTEANANTSAALTFELVTLLSDKDGNKMTSKWDNNNQDYTNSILRANLNGTGSGTKSFGSTVLSMLPSELQTAIKTVNKKVSKDSTFTVTSYNDKLFPLTMTEMAQSHGESSKFKEEGTAYKYWTDHGDSEDRTKKDAKGNASDYWLVSPSTKNLYSAWYVNNEGDFNGIDTDEIYGVSFGFCI